MSQADIMAAAGWLTVATAAEAAGVHFTTIYRLAKSGRISAKTVGRTRYVSRDDLIRYYASAPPIVARLRST